MKKDNLMKLSIFFTWINIIHIYVRILKMCWFKYPGIKVILKKTFSSIFTLYIKLPDLVMLYA